MVAFAGEHDMENINIEVSEPGEQVLFADNELWVTVTGPDPLPDYQTVRRLAKGQGVQLPAMPFRYYPSLNGPGEPYSELWVVKRV